MKGIHWTKKCVKIAFSECLFVALEKKTIVVEYNLGVHKILVAAKRYCQNGSGQRDMTSKLTHFLKKNWG